MKTPTKILLSVLGGLAAGILTCAVAILLLHLAAWARLIDGAGIGGGLLCIAAGLVAAPSVAVLMFFGWTRKGLLLCGLAFLAVALVMLLPLVF
ncbi:MAG: hypothetical protein H8E44_36555 [Planctomycetes bacterium]|nr:hypothetical protein [Planctomycetota bacterium]